MSAPAWTPGPWGITSVSIEDGSIGIAKDRIVIAYATNASSFGDFINEALTKGTFGSPGAATTQWANARLIAAAPDFADHAASLIEAWDARTTGAQQIITGKSDAELQKQAMAAIEGLRAALAKARGEQT